MKEKCMKSCARGTSTEQTLHLARSQKGSIKLECKGSACSAVCSAACSAACSAVRCFAVKVTGFHKQKLFDYVRFSSYSFFTFLQLKLLVLQANLDKQHF
jgi:hypothetical protein